MFVTRHTETFACTKAVMTQTRIVMDTDSARLFSDFLCCVA